MATTKTTAKKKSGTPTKQGNPTPVNENTYAFIFSQIDPGEI